LRDYWIGISSDKDFLGPAPFNVHIRDPVRRLCHRMIACSITANVSYLLAQYLFRHAKGRKSQARLSGGHFIGCLAAHFGLVSDEGLKDLSIVARELLVASGPERRQAATAGTPRAAKDALAADEGAQAVPAHVQAPQPPPPAPQHRTMCRHLEEEAFDSTLFGSLWLSYQRRVRPRTNDANTSTAPHTND
ncbi:hypothetical protein Tco_0131124, partial [Tanacetum coccineum]